MLEAKRLWAWDPHENLKSLLSSKIEKMNFCWYTMCFQGKGKGVQNVRFPRCVKPPGIIGRIQRKVFMKFHFLLLHSMLSREGGGSRTRRGVTQGGRRSRARRGGGVRWCGSARGRSSQKSQVSIKSQTGVIPQKLKMWHTNERTNMQLYINRLLFLNKIIQFSTILTIFILYFEAQKWSSFPPSSTALMAMSALK